MTAMPSNDSGAAAPLDRSSPRSPPSAALAAAGGRARCSSNIFERKQEARNPFYPRGRADRRHRGSRRSGARTSRCSTTATGGRSTRCARATAAARRCRARRPRPIRARSSRSRGSRRTRGSRRCGRATPSRRTSARSAATPTCSTTRRSPSGSSVAKQPGTCLHCHASVYVPYKKARRRRPHQGLREDEPDAVRRGAQAGRRTRSPASTATTRRRCSCASRGPASSRASGRSRRAQGVADYDVNSDGDAPGDARLRLRPVPRRVLLQGPREAAHLPVGQGPARSTRSSPTTTRIGLQGLDARGDGRAGAQGAAPRVRDVEPGHPRALGRRLRRLPHALHARGRAEDQRPPRAQPAAQHQPRLPDLPQVAGGGAARRASRRSRSARSSCATARWTRWWR